MGRHFLALPRALAAAALLAGPHAAVAGTIDELFADGYEDLPDCEALRGTPACPGFALTSAAIPANAPDGIRASCWFFRAPNAGAVAVREFESSLGAGVARIVLYATLDGSGAPVERFPPGTIVQDDCETTGTAGISPRRLYQAHAPLEALAMPADDGNGDPVAIELAAQQPLALAIHRTTADAAPATTQVDLIARGLRRGRPYTPTATYATFNGSINIPPNANGHVVSQTCAVPANVAFWWFSTHTHKYAVQARVQETPTVTTLVQSSDWEAPSITTFPSAPFHLFAPGEQLRYECTYFNPSGRTITAGTDEDNDEQCVAITYFFPASRPLLCFNNVGPL